MYGLKLKSLQLSLKPGTNKMANVYVSGTIAIAAKVLSNHRMQQRILTLIEFRE